MNGYLVLEDGYTIHGEFHGGDAQVGEVVFNTSHSGYEEMATDPSYHSQILVLTATQQGNYGIADKFWESKNIWIRGFICLEIQNSARDSGWLHRLRNANVPVLSGVDTRSLVLHLRGAGTQWGAVVRADSEAAAQDEARRLIRTAKQERTSKATADWTKAVSRKKVEDRRGHKTTGPRVAVLDFGSKENILRELELRCREIRIYPSDTKADEILNWQPDGILLTNGPGDPADVRDGIETVKQLIAYNAGCKKERDKKFIFGICMGHQVLGLALGGRTYRLKFGHRGSNHPIRDRLLNRVYVTSQNHGYNVDIESLPTGVDVTHVNLNDQTVAGIYHREWRCLSVQFHPESHPGPHESSLLFDYFTEQGCHGSRSN